MKFTKNMYTVVIILMLILIMPTVICDVVIPDIYQDDYWEPPYDEPEDTVDAHEHSFSKWNVLLPASCTSIGQQQRTCSSCGFSECSEITMIPHTIIIDLPIFSTCTTNGKSEGKHCSVCNEIIVEQRIIEKLGHTIVTDQSIAPTCTSNGKSEGAHCSICQAILIPQTEIEALGHKYDAGVVTDIATFWKQGKIKFSCTSENCDSSYYEKYSVTTITSADNYSQSTENKLYTFCAISDIHLTRPTANEDFQRALVYAEKNCDFTCVAGDLTVNGTADELAVYKKLVDDYAKTKPVYAITGNHENYSTVCRDFLQKYTGTPLYYSFTQGDDVFIMLGHYGGYAGDGGLLGGWRPSEFLSIEEVQWLYETLEANRNKRCFIFTHVLPHEEEVGNPCGLYKTAPIWYTKTHGGLHDNGLGKVVIDLIKHYKNAILFHGHSHTRFGLQELDEKANCSDANGYRSVHIPSLAIPRDFANGALINVDKESEGYIIDVYDDYIILRGRDFIDNDGDGHWIKNATYKIDTRLYNIEANTFTDSTGTIKVIQK